MWPINLSHSPIYSNILHFSQANSGCILHFSKTKHPRFLHFSRKSLLRYFGYGVRHSMIKSASIVRNLSKNHTFRTIASILIDTQSRFPANFNWAKPPFPRNLIYVIPPFPINLAEFYNINSAIAGVKNHPCWV